MSIKTWVTIGIVYVVLVFAGYTVFTGNNPFESGEMEHDEHANEETHDSDEHGEDSHGGMDHSAEEMSSSGEVPSGLETSENPTYAVGSEAVISADHMPGMDGAVAEISGAFETTVYTVSYTTDDGEEIEDHKWVIHEELEVPDEAPLSPGDEVVLKTDHMEGMYDAEAEIDSAEETTVYMVDFETTDTNEAVQYHKWVTEAELSPVD